MIAAIRGMAAPTVAESVFQDAANRNIYFEKPFGLSVRNQKKTFIAAPRIDGEEAQDGRQMCLEVRQAQTGVRLGGQEEAFTMISARRSGCKKYLI